MTAVALLIVVLSHDGYWISGQEATVRVLWAVEPAPAEGHTLTWQLGRQDVRLAEGRIEMPPPPERPDAQDDQDNEDEANDARTEIRIMTPTVRTRTRLTFTWQLRDADADVIDHGSALVHVFPEDHPRWAHLDELLQDQRVVVLDAPAGLPRLLDHLELTYKRVDTMRALVPGRVDLLLVGQDQLDDAAHPNLRRVAALGGTVIIFTQAGPTHLLGLRTTSRLSPPMLAYRRDEPIFAALGDETVRSWLQSDDVNTWHAVRVESEDAATPLAIWPPVPASIDERGKARVVQDPLDAAVTTLHIGRGRALLWQIPLDDWRDDPRSAAVFANVVDWAVGSNRLPTTTPRLGPRARWRYAHAWQSEATNANHPQ